MEQRREFFASLEGIRGYAFLLVFLIHYNVRPANPFYNSFYLLTNSLLFLVPIFFVLSGFLITRILFATQDREGYFRAFYFRRAVRVFPIYYLTFFVIAVIVLIRHWQFHPSLLLYLVYLQNFNYTALQGNIQFSITHLWSLALEEQFYLIWPVVIWFLRSEKAVLRFCYCFIVASCLIRVAWPLFNIPYEMAYYSSVTRADAIVLGAALAIQYQRRTYWRQLLTFGKFLVPILWLAVAAVVLIRGNGLINDYVGVAAMIPAYNLIGAGFVLLALDPASVVNRLCSKSSICRVGRLSYSLYIFHFIYLRYFHDLLRTYLLGYMPSWLAWIVSTGAALGTTFALAAIAYRLIEEPAIRWKEIVKYGERKVRIPVASTEPLSPGFELAG
jgi:peptidoglycan/LPS O-acetylase OafA/YrhL